MPGKYYEVVIDKRTGEATTRELDGPKTMAQLLHDCPVCRAAMAARGMAPAVATDDAPTEGESRQVRRARERRARRR
ncbi:MAG: hypothetical protein R2939_04610 [Kofleriaceae bacterium]